MDINDPSYAEKIRKEGEFWDQEFLEGQETAFKCFLHHNEYFRDQYTYGFLNHIKKLVQPGERALDLGCGQGWLSIWLAQQGMRVEGVDVARQALESARETAVTAGVAALTDFHYLDANTAESEPGSYALIMSWGALHHVANLEFAIKNMEAALTDGGRLVILESVDRVGTRAKIANALADVFHFLLPTDRSYGEKIAHVKKKLEGREAEEFEWSPFEMAGGQGWLSLLEEHFSVEYKLGFMGFLSPFIARLRLPRRLGYWVSGALSGLDWLLIKLRVVKPEYYFMVLRKR